MSSIMELLAMEWRIGYIVSASICVVSYIIYSILLVRSCRKVGYDIGVSGMIPFWNLILLFKKRKYSKKVKSSKEIFALDDEIEL